jgi:hypothetical protein
MEIYTQSKAEGITKQHFQFDNSFGPFIRFLKEKQLESTDIRVKFYRYLVKKFEQHPALVVPFTDVMQLEQHDDLVQLLRMSLLPLSTNTEDIPMALAFLQPSCLFYYTEKFKEIFINEQIEFNTEEDICNNLRYFVKLVLERCYNIKTDITPKIIKQVSNRDKHSLRHHQLHVDSRFIEVHQQGKLPAYNHEWLRMINADDDEFAMLFEQFPSKSFRLEGFCMLMAEDVSEDIAINKLKNAVLNMHTANLECTINNVELAVRELMNDSNIVIGITPFFKLNGKLVYDKSFIAKCVGLTCNQNSLADTVSLTDIYTQFSAATKPYIFSNIDEDLLNSRPYLSGLVESNIKSFMVQPIKTREGLIGIFEVGSSIENHITPATISCLQPAIPLITDLINYMIDTFEARIQQLVKEKFTPLQQSVEWKFNEVAWNYLVHENTDKTTSIGTVVFENVYPLYGAVDIRNSSVERNLASKNDYIHQLNATLTILQQTARDGAIPLIESIQFKCETLLSSITHVLTSEDELTLREFFEEEVYVLFRHIAERDASLTLFIRDYMKRTGTGGGFHQNHKNYEDSIDLLNQNMVKFFDDEAHRLQELFPFYYEKFRTDGVEYNMYIGQTIVPDIIFNPIYVKNLRAWQVSAMAQVARMNERLRRTLPLPLQTTQLILVNGSPIDISFRKDERRFDVEGAYNIRYEILKKRIDKVRIKGTLERLTQPDKIAIVYSSTAEIQDYLHHIQYLQSKGLLIDNVEMLDLENVQGISGLKAVRVGVNYERDDKDTYVDNLLQFVGTVS